jgi:hypothetical protein
MFQTDVLEVHETRSLCPVHFSVESCDFRDEQIGDILPYACVSQIMRFPEHERTLPKSHILDKN